MVGSSGSPNDHRHRHSDPGRRRHDCTGLRPVIRHLVIFAKAPALGRAKRRLGHQIGPLEAARFYRRTLERTVARCGRDRRWQTWLWITPDKETTDPAWKAASRWLPKVGQGSGDLGVRMARPFRRLPPGPVVLIGSDIPTITADIVAAAFHALRTHDLVFGPATDGGYWMVGAKRVRPWPRGLFQGVRWSTERALADTLANIGGHFTVGLVDTLEDIDDAESYKRWKETRA